jgi:hypothetical protein
MNSVVPHVFHALENIFYRHVLYMETRMRWASENDVAKDRQSEPLHQTAMTLEAAGTDARASCLSASTKDQSIIYIYIIVHCVTIHI